MIDVKKTYRTRDGREARVYATDGKGPWPVHGAVKDDDRWSVVTWRETGKQNVGSDSYSDLIPADPHGILPRHRELLAEAMVEHKHDFGEWVEIVRTGTFTSLSPSQHVALIALARLEKEKS